MCALIFIISNGTLNNIFLVVFSCVVCLNDMLGFLANGNDDPSINKHCLLTINASNHGFELGCRK